MNLAIKLLRRNGTLLSFGLPHKYKYNLAFNEFFWNEGRLISSLDPTVEDFRIAVDLIANKRIDVSPLITHAFPLSEAQQAFTLFANRADGADQGCFGSQKIDVLFLNAMIEINSWRSPFLNVLLSELKSG